MVVEVVRIAEHIAVSPPPLPIHIQLNENGLLEVAKGMPIEHRFVIGNSTVEVELLVPQLPFIGLGGGLQLL